jgi:hypothetical protein
MYKLINSPMTNELSCILRLSDKAFIPVSEDNADYQEYMRWVDSGNTPEPADPIPVLVKPEIPGVIL